MTGMLPPAHSFVQRYGPLLEQLGATKIDTPTDYEIRLTYTNNAAAVNATAAFNDVVAGAKLIVDNKSVSRDRPVPTAGGLVRMVSQVPKTTATVVGSLPQNVLVGTRDPIAFEGLKQLLRPQPALHGGPTRVDVVLYSEPQPS